MKSWEMLNDMGPEEATASLLRLCGSTRWARAVYDRHPFGSAADLHAAAEAAWTGLERNDWLEAFAAHPRIGDVDSLRKKYASTAELCSGEQAGVAGADETVLHDLASGNAEYEKRFGHIFLVFATGKSAAEMLAILRARMTKGPEEEFRIACGEQVKITRLRLEKL